MFTQTSAAALNHLLSQNSWALSRLARHAGKTARFDIAPLAFAYTILDDGKLLAAGAATEPDALCVIAPSLLPRLALLMKMRQGDTQRGRCRIAEGDILSVAQPGLGHGG